MANENKLNKLMQKAGSVVEVELNVLRVVTEKRMLSKIRAIVDNNFQ
uniref:Uncharacterized protein n=1 Tax=Nothobranchius korthausae TaxID=1143690 RepID=A0A1A8G3I2_9TELE